ncbi:MAG: hypothetical protein ABSF48_24300 [Thermodesulfobacteriota bacterium]|jgi:hypothetical protein
MNKETKHPADIYGEVVLSFLLGSLRLWRAAAAAHRLNCALCSFHVTGENVIQGHPYQNTLNHLAKIPRSSYDSLQYITNVSHLVYATTLLDTFLTDTTLFLFLSFPQSIGTNYQVSLSTLLASSSRSEVLTVTAIKKAREISYLPFLGRIDYLRKTFGLDISMPSSVSDALEHYPSIRNTVLHDQGVFEITLADDGSIQSRQKTSPHRPTQVNTTDVETAANSYEKVVLTIARAIIIQVLKAPNHPVLESLLKARIGQHDSIDNESAGDANSP